MTLMPETALAIVVGGMNSGMVLRDVDGDTDTDCRRLRGNAWRHPPSLAVAG